MKKSLFLILLLVPKLCYAEKFSQRMERYSQKYGSQNNLYKPPPQFWNSVRNYDKKESSITPIEFFWQLKAIGSGIKNIFIKPKVLQNGIYYKNICSQDKDKVQQEINNFLQRDYDNLKNLLVHFQGKNIPILVAKPNKSEDMELLECGYDRSDINIGRFTDNSNTNYNQIFKNDNGSYAFLFKNNETNTQQDSVEKDNLTNQNTQIETENIDNSENSPNTDTT